jgi:hypothetical protein
MSQNAGLKSSCFDLLSQKVGLKILHLNALSGISNSTAVQHSLAQR